MLQGVERRGDAGQRDVAAACGLVGRAAGDPERVDGQTVWEERERPGGVLATEPSERAAGGTDHDVGAAAIFAGVVDRETEKDGAAVVSVEEVGQLGERGLVCSGAVECRGEGERVGALLRAEREAAGRLRLDVEASSGDLRVTDPSERGSDDRRREHESMGFEERKRSPARAERARAGAGASRSGGRTVHTG